jgi:radical SAM protein with 4Fe4S-binding SPASM domain
MNEIELPESYKYIAALLTMKCNLNCSFCLNAFSSDHFDRRAFLEVGGEQWVEGLNRIHSRPGVPVTFSGGEPFLHKGFLGILKGLRKDLGIDILTNLQWGNRGIERFIAEIDPARINREAPYPPIRVSYHPEQMGRGIKLVRDAKRLQEAGFKIGIYAVQYPSSAQLEAITQMQFLCINEGVEFRVKDFTGKYEGVDDSGRPFSITHGDYSKYQDSTFRQETKDCLCKTSELLIGPNGDVYRCHRDMYSGEGGVGNILDPSFEIKDEFRPCSKYGQCHPCDVKVKTDHKQQLGHTSVEIKDIQ